jgi:hypothetical protein
MDEPYHQAMATIDRYLASAVGLSPTMTAAYRAAAEKVLRAMGPKAIKRWNANVQSLSFYPDTESIGRFARRMWPDFASIAWNQPVAARRQHPHCWAFWSERGLV